MLTLKLSAPYLLAIGKHTMNICACLGVCLNTLETNGLGTVRARNRLVCPLIKLGCTDRTIHTLLKALLKKCPKQQLCKVATNEKVSKTNSSRYSVRRYSVRKYALYNCTGLVGFSIFVYFLGFWFLYWFKLF